VTDQETEPAATTDAPAAPARSPLIGRIFPALVVTLAGVGLGALGGWLWYVWWGPPNTGTIYDTVDGPQWYDLTDQGVAHQFDGPAEYAIVGLVFGIVLGILAAVLGRRQALVALVGLAVGSALAAYLSFVVGTALSPPDPQDYATADNIDKEYPAAIELSGWTPFLVWPIGALGAFCTAIVAMSGAGEVRRQQAGQEQAGTWLQPAVKADQPGQ
jgi:hypothetical protein